MKTVSQLLEQHGPPPVEVALDWAWQLHDWGHESAGRSARANTSEESVPLTWECVQVGEDGVLRIASPGDEDGNGASSSGARGIASAVPLIHSAMKWGGFSAEAPAEADSFAVDATQLEAALTAATARIACSSSETSATSAPVELKTSSHSGEKPTRNRRATRTAPNAKAKQRWLLAASFMVGVCLLTVLWPVFFGADSPVQEMADARRTAPNSDAANGRPASGEQLQDISPMPSTMPNPSSREESGTPLTLGFGPSTEAVDLAGLGDFATEAPLAELSLLGQGLTIGISSDVTSAKSEPESSPDLTREEIMQEMSTVGDPRAASVATSDSEQARPSDSSEQNLLNAEHSNAEMAADSAEEQVNATLAEMAKQAEQEAPETEIPARVDAANGQGKNADPLRVATFPMIQWQKLPVRERVREPEWQIRIAVSEGFVVRPATAQTVKPREPARWYVQEKDAAKGATQMVVVAQVSGSRGDRLRWLIAAGSEDSPYTALPVGQRYLDLLQTNLLHFQRQLRSAILGLKQLSTIEDLPGQAKSMLRMRRKNLEAKLEASEEVSKLAAEANRMEGWLDGQIEVHALLRDSRAAGSPAVLQFGSVEVGGPLNEPERDSDSEAEAAGSEP